MLRNLTHGTHTVRGWYADGTRMVRGWWSRIGPGEPGVWIIRLAPWPLLVNVLPPEFRKLGYLMYSTVPTVVATCTVVGRYMYYILEIS